MFSGHSETVEFIFKANPCVYSTIVARERERGDGVKNECSIHEFCAQK